MIILNEITRKQRQSNFELLRIIAMMGIILYHLVLHHINYDRFALITTERGPNFWHLDIIQIFYTFGQIANTIFILITGYFLIDKKDINVIKPAGKLLNRTYMTVFILLGLAYLFNRFQYPIKTNMDIDMSLNGWWFIGYYIFVIVFAKYILNPFLQRLRKKDFFGFVVIFIILLGFMEIFDILDNLNMENLAIGISVYSVGAYLRLYEPLSKVRTWTLLLFLTSFFALEVIEYKVNTQRITQVFFNQESIDTFVNEPFTNTLWSSSVLFLLCSIVVFELFRRLPIGSIRWVNWLSKSVFTVYLFHESNFFRNLLVRGETLPTRLGILNKPATIIVNSGEEKGLEVVLKDPETWLELPDFLNISQVFQDRGAVVGTGYMLLLMVVIFLMGVLLDLVIRMLNGLLKKLFATDIRNLRQQFYD